MIANFTEIKNDDEALVILSSIGFHITDFSCIKKLDGALAFLASEPVQRILQQKLDEDAFFKNRYLSLRKWLDFFYESSGVLITPYNSPTSSLFRYKKAPLVFFVRYHHALLHALQRVSIVGSRNPSDDALNFTTTLAQTLAQKNITVVSGGAVGIDHAAHVGALKGSGNTIIIAGTAFTKNSDRHIKLAMTAAENCAVVYPFSPLTPQKKFMFVERNRYVAMMSEALVVIQGKKGSGTLHTASFAEKLKMPIWALPGHVHCHLSFAPNYLLQAGVARALVDVDHFVSTVTKADKPLKKPAFAVKDRMKNLEEKQELPYLLRIIRDKNNAISFDELVAITGRSFTDLQKELLDLELLGCLKKRGAQFVLTGN